MVDRVSSFVDILSREDTQFLKTAPCWADLTQWDVNNQNYVSELQTRFHEVQQSLLENRLEADHAAELAKSLSQENGEIRKRCWNMEVDLKRTSAERDDHVVECKHLRTHCTEMEEQLSIVLDDYQRLETEFQASTTSNEQMLGLLHNLERKHQTLCDGHSENGEMLEQTSLYSPKNDSDNDVTFCVARPNDSVGNRRTSQVTKMKQDLPRTDSEMSTESKQDLPNSRMTDSETSKESTQYLPHNLTDSLKMNTELRSSFLDEHRSSIYSSKQLVLRTQETKQYLPEEHTSARTGYDPSLPYVQTNTRAHSWNQLLSRRYQRVEFSHWSNAHE